MKVGFSQPNFTRVYFSCILVSFLQKMVFFINFETIVQFLCVFSPNAFSRKIFTVFSGVQLITTRHPQDTSKDIKCKVIIDIQGIRVITTVHCWAMVGLRHNKKILETFSKYFLCLRI